MGKQEAKEDGIEYYYDANRGARGYSGATVYKVMCSVCGSKMETVVYGRNRKYICDSCKQKRAWAKKEIEKEWFDIIEEKGEHRFNQALDAIEAQVSDFSQYEKAVRGARKAQGKYGSIPEAMVAVELLHIGYPFIPQFKVNRYRVDFYIPSIKTVIEIDGEIYHRNIYKNDREARIQIALGFETKIIHIPAELISKDIRKLKQIIYAARKEP